MKIIFMLKSNSFQLITKMKENLLEMTPFCKKNCKWTFYVQIKYNQRSFCTFKKNIYNKYYYIIILLKRSMKKCFYTKPFLQ